MARATQPPPSQHAILDDAKKIRRSIERLQERIEEVKAFDPKIVKKQFECPELTTLTTAIEETLTTVFGHNTIEHNRYRRAYDFNYGPINMYRPTPLPTVHKALAESKGESIALLEQAVRFLNDQLEDAADEPTPLLAAAPAELSNRVFIVHGHDREAKEAVARLLTTLRLEPIILHEQPNMGRTIIEKFEAEGDVGFAVVLLTPDDQGKAKTDTGDVKDRARQNVIMELGYFIGALGRAKVCALVRGTVETPSDFAGVVYEKNSMTVAHGNFFLDAN